MTDTNGAGQQEQGGEKKPTINEVLASLVKRNKKLDDELQEEKEIRGLADRRNADAAEDLQGEVERLRAALFLLYSCYMDLIAVARTSDDPEVAEDAAYHTNLSMGQQASIAPKMYEAAYGFDAQTGELLPGRTAGVPVPLEEA